jgi:hypothetical protein
VRNNLIRSNPPGSEILIEDGTTRPILSGNILNQDPLFQNRAQGDFRLQAKSPALGKAAGQNLGAK